MLDRRLSMDTTRLTAREIGLGDVALLHELTVSVGWPHRRRDLAFLIEHGRGYVGCDEIGRAIGAALWVPMGPDHAQLGMSLTVPRFEARRGWRWLWDRNRDEAAGRTLMCNAMWNRVPVYEDEGFRRVGKVHQFQGRAAMPGPLPAPPAGEELRLGGLADLADIRRLDRAALDCDRSAILAAALERWDLRVIARKGTITGFAICRPFGRGHVIGPIVAGDDAGAIALAAPFVAEHAGDFLRVDSARTAGEFAAFLAGCGLRVAGEAEQMRLGPDARTDPAAISYALMSQALG